MPVHSAREYAILRVRQALYMARKHREYGERDLSAWYLNDVQYWRQKLLRDSQFAKDS